ncbi:MAG TPA: AraC family transcriptional regulator [Candidatus Anaerobiospirillum pullistercoris]|uniref:AraC family transcriptional regulator n=1 Tax=Candidatus Anaerobiospirillum pullistercoris TaxID=2838452 RepID=A0A9D1WGD6_9GAMM|nr:AraC family transcriptional regulator [Candidatus Anaerobiospirillum pullistercoris]
MAASHNEQHREVIVTTEKYPVRFFRSRDRGSYVPYHYHDAFEFIYLTQGAITLSSLNHQSPLSCFIARLPQLPRTLPAQIDLSFGEQQAPLSPDAVNAANAASADNAATTDNEADTSSEDTNALASNDATPARTKAHRKKGKYQASGSPNSSNQSELDAKSDKLPHISLAEQSAATLGPLPDSAITMRPSSSHPQNPRAQKLLANMTENNGSTSNLRALATAKLFDSMPDDNEMQSMSSAGAGTDVEAGISVATVSTAAASADTAQASANANTSELSPLPDTPPVAGDLENLEYTHGIKAHYGYAKGLTLHPSWQESSNFSAQDSDVGPTYEMSAQGYNFALINSNEMHASSCQNYNEAYVLQIPEKFLTELSDYREGFPLYLNPHLASRSCLERFSRAFLRLAVIHEHYQEQAGFMIHFNHALYAILECLMEMIVPVSTLSQIQNDLNFSLMRSANLKRLQPVFDFLKNHYHEHIKLEQMAAVAHLHPGYFCQFFKEAVGMSPLNYLSELRLCHIYYDLAEQKLPISEILQRHGYTNAKKFYRLFKERFHQSPTEVRAQHAAHNSAAHRGYSYFERLYQQSQGPEEPAVGETTSQTAQAAPASPAGAQQATDSAASLTSKTAKAKTISTAAANAASILAAKRAKAKASQDD